MNDIEEDTRQTKRDIGNRNFLEAAVFTLVLFFLLTIFFGAIHLLR